MPKLPTIDLTKIKLPFDLPKIEFPTIDLSAMKIGGVELPFELPQFKLPGFELRNVDLPSAEQVIDFFRDAALAGTGLVSLTAERIADLQKQLVEALKAQVEKARNAA